MISTVNMSIRAVLPNGTNDERFIKARREAHPDEAAADKLFDWRIVPFLPTDLFAAAGYLCRAGGVMGFFDPNPFQPPSGPHQFYFSKQDRKEADAAGKSWRLGENAGEPPQFVQDLWDKIIASADETVPNGPYLRAKTAPPEWWHAALMLVTISDMACGRLLRDPLAAHSTSPFEEHVKAQYAASLSTNEKPPASLTLVADTALVTVLPKVRVAPVGATLRNVTRNLALLPGRGEVRCSWDMSNAKPPSDNIGTLDILLIPAPVTLNAADFESCANFEHPETDKHYWMKNWENFRIRQRWIETPELAESFIADCEKLLRQAQLEARNVDAVVLPEYAITYPIFDELCTRLKSIEPALEFMISGSSSNCEGDTGNQLLTRVWVNPSDSTQHLTVSRRKHHRWRMNRSQVEAYALGASLNPLVQNWWEDTPLGQREVHFFRFRNASVFSVLICEELARSDPCHEILRSVAPNLIFALLLDGPQIRKRWPAQYASNLADDPGSAVLTFTGYGLIERSNKQGHFDSNHSIALWKDDTGRVVEIPMPAGTGIRGVLLSLWSEPVLDLTITGKQSQVRAWRYGNHFPVLRESS